MNIAQWILVLLLGALLFSMPSCPKLSEIKNHIADYLYTHKLKVNVIPNGYELFFERK